jgi:hypothetical protein
MGVNGPAGVFAEVVGVRAGLSGKALCLAAFEAGAVEVALGGIVRRGVEVEGAVFDIIDLGDFDDVLGA